MMNLEEIRIYRVLKANPGTTYISSDGHMLYALMDGGMLCIPSDGTNLHGVGEPRINELIQDFITDKK